MKKLIAVLLCFIICFAFTGCDIGITSVDLLMRPPKLSGQNSLIQQTFELTVGDSESIIMKSPLSGENRSSYLMYDLDNDKVSEALVLYSDPAIDTVAFISVFKLVNDEWSFVSTIKGKSEEIYSVDFADINGDDSFEILISWASVLTTDGNISTPMGNTNDRMLTIYSYDEKNVSLLRNDTYTKLMVTDINNDNADELFLINMSFSTTEKKTVGRIVSFDEKYAIESDIKFNLTGMLEVFNIVSDTYISEESVHTRIYVDGAISEAGFITEIIDISHETLEITLPFYVVNVSAQPTTLRDVKVASQDVDADGVIEVPTVEALFGGIRVYEDADRNSNLNLTLWSEAQGDVLILDTKCIYNGNFGYMFVFPEEWIGVITAVYSENTNVITFYSVSENGELTAPLFSLKPFYTLDWEEGHEGYTAFEDSDTYVYGFRVIDDENRSSYIDILENNFILLKQV